MALAGPPPVSTNPFLRLADDLRRERAAPIPFPPGDTRPSVRRTERFARSPLPVLLDAYERHGPVFTLRIFHGNVVFMLGPEANHFITVSHASNFEWRTGHMGDLIPLLGDGLLTIDGAFHRRHRKLMLPAFHRERIERATAVSSAADALPPRLMLATAGVAWLAVTQSTPAMTPEKVPDPLQSRTRTATSATFLATP
jgi:cytochrome P450